MYARRVKEQGGKVVVEAELRSRSHSIKIEMEHLMGLADYVVMGEDFLTEVSEKARFPFVCTARRFAPRRNSNS